MATPFTRDQVIEPVTADDDDVDECFDFRSDDELEFHRY